MVTVVAAVDQARGWGSAEAAVSTEQVDHHHLLSTMSVSSCENNL